MSEPHQARKRFGQNFLSDKNIIYKIIEAIRPDPADRMVEIGPGLGAMTEPLMSRLDHLHVVEIDRDLIARLKEAHSPDKLTIHEGDALKFDFGSLVADGAPLRVVGNLPYNISTPILFHLADYADKVKDMTFMLQKEVVMRMVGDPGTEEYGRLSVMLQYRFNMRRVFDVPPGAFRPAPKVMSSIVRMVPRPAAECTARDYALLGKVVTAAFGQRRKMIRQSLKATGVPVEKLLAAAGLTGQERAEELPVAAFLTMAKALRA